MDHNREDLVNSARVRCPRCGYDQRGVLATWADSCPLQGVCSECGLDLEWSRVLQPEKYEPQWCVEFVPRRAQLLSACAMTWLTSWLPWRFWRRIDMSHEPRWRRLGVYLVFLSLFVFISALMLQVTASVVVRTLTEQRLAAARPLLTDFISESTVELDSIASTLNLPNLDPDDRNELQWRQQQIQQHLNVYRNAAASTDWLSHSRLQTFAEAVLLPWRSTSNCVVAVPQWGPYPPPRRLVMEALYQRSAAGTRWPSGYPLMLVLLLALSVVSFVIFPLGMVALPVSLRRARVRWVHLARISIYGLFIPAILVAFAAGTLSYHCATSNYDSMWSAAFATAAKYGCLVLGTLWWWASIRWYLRLPHAAAVAVLLSVLSTLIVLAAAWFVMPNLVVSALE